MFEVPNLLASSRAPASNFFFSIRSSCSGDSCPPAELVWVGEGGGGEAHGVFLGSGESSSSGTRALVCDMMAHVQVQEQERAANSYLFSTPAGSIRKNDSQYGDVNYAWAGHVTTPPSESAHARVSGL